MIPFYLVSGFLGSGKTTFLKNILSTYSENHRIAIIQNEFAPTGVDGKDLNLTGHPFKLVEINNGSVFCVCLLGTFIQTLEKLIKEYSPEMIFLEASGLADPVNIIELLQKESLRENLSLKNIFTIVDAPNYERGIKTLPRFRHQVMIADTIIINKSDLYKAEISILHDQIRTLNPFADILETSYCKIDLERYIFNDAAEHSAAASFKGTDSEGRPQVNACVLRSHNRLTKEGLFTFVTELQKSSPRIKGFVNMQDGKVTALQTVFEHLEMKEIKGYVGPTEIIAFGENLTPGYLREIMNKPEK